MRRGSERTITLEAYLLRKGAARDKAPFPEGYLLGKGSDCEAPRNHQLAQPVLVDTGRSAIMYHYP